MVDVLGEGRVGVWLSLVHASTTALAPLPHAVPDGSLTQSSQVPLMVQSVKMRRSIAHCQGVATSCALVARSLLCTLPQRPQLSLVSTLTTPVSPQREAHKHDESPLDPECDCMVCKKYTKSFMYFMAAKDISSATSLVTYHNMHYMARLGR